LTVVNDSWFSYVEDDLSVQRDGETYQSAIVAPTTPAEFTRNLIGREPPLPAPNDPRAPLDGPQSENIHHPSATTRPEESQKHVGRQVTGLQRKSGIGEPELAEPGSLQDECHAYIYTVGGYLAVLDLEFLHRDRGTFDVLDSL
jgi:hypothetical protein